MSDEPRPTTNRKLSSDKPVYASPPSPEATALHSGWSRTSNPHVPPRLRENPPAPEPHPE